MTPRKKTDPPPPAPSAPATDGAVAPSSRVEPTDDLAQAGRQAVALLTQLGETDRLVGQAPAVLPQDPDGRALRVLGDHFVDQLPQDCGHVRRSLSRSRPPAAAAGLNDTRQPPPQQAEPAGLPPPATCPRLRLQPGARADIKGEARTGYLGPAIKVKNAQALPDVPVRLRGEVKLPDVPPSPHFLIVLAALSGDH